MRQPIFSTDFTQADGAPSSPWVNSGWNGSTGALQVLSNRLRSNAAISTEIPMSVIDTVLPRNQYLEFSLPTFSVGAGVTIYAIGVLRIVAAPTQTYIRIWCASVAGVTRFDLSTIVSGGAENFFDSTTLTLAAGDRVRFEAVDNRIRLYRNGTHVYTSIANNDVLGDGRVGISFYYTAGAQSDAEVDNLELGICNLTKPSGVVSRPRPFAPGLAR